MITCHFDAKFKLNETFTGISYVKRPASINKIVNVCRDDLLKYAKEWDKEVKHLSMFIVYFKIKDERYEIMGWDRTLSKPMIADETYNPFNGT